MPRRTLHDTRMNCFDSARALAMRNEVFGPQGEVVPSPDATLFRALAAGHYVLPPVEDGTPELIDMLEKGKITLGAIASDRNLLLQVAAMHASISGEGSFYAHGWGDVDTF